MATNYEQIAKDARIKVLDLIYKAQTSHIGSNFSAIDIMAVLFEKADPSKDEIVLSAGWKAAAWYYFLWKKGIITQEELDSFCMPKSPFIGLVEPMERWGLRCAGGSMGFGLPFAVGFALAKKMKKEDGIVYVLMSDGELQCGTTWESALIAARHKLDNLVVIVDYNGLQAMGKTNEILNIEPLKEKWKSFQWDVWEIDGHNFEMIEKMMETPRAYCFDDRKKEEISLPPRIIIARTIKGKGVSFMENNNLFHYKAPSKEEYQRAMSELNI